jgi:hypothetical protein
MEAKMSLKARRELLFRIWSRYLDAGKHEKTLILNGFVAATGYRRKYAISLLNAGPATSAPRKRTRRAKYNEEVRRALLTVWNTANQICGKRLVNFIPTLVASLERFGHLQLNDETRNHLLSLSAATIDRIVSGERAATAKGKSLTKAGSLLKQSIKVRTFADWKEAEPGFFEADLVAHCGERVDGAFLNTLVLTDIATAWTEFAPLLRRSSADVNLALEGIRQAMPMPLLGLDTDNGAEFINHQLFEYCDQERISFTRSRPYRKNDQAHVEQKNGNIIRRIVGYDRYEGQEAWRQLLSLYRSLRLYVNFFQPSMKLIHKRRDRSKVSKRYDRAQTPYERILKSTKIPNPTKDKLTMVFQQLDPVALLDDIRKQQDLLSPVSSEEAVVDVMPANVVEAPTTSEADMQKELIASFKWPRKKHKRTKQSGQRHWRTRKDPFESVEAEIMLAFQLEPDIQAIELLARLQARHPGMFKGNEIRTLRRRLAMLRMETCDPAVFDLNVPSYVVADLVRN